MKKSLTIIGVICIFLSGCNSPSSKKGALSHDQLMSGAYRTEKNGWIFVHLQGSPEAIGYQHGYLLADEILDLKNTMSVMDEKSYGKPWSFFRDESFKLFWHKIPQEYKQEIEGIVRGASATLGDNKIDRKDILAINSDMELPDYYIPWLNGIKDPKPDGHCSAIAATGSWTKDGKIVLAHNNWTSYAIGERWNIIIDLVPEKGNRIVMDAMPGLINSGDDFYINSEGIIVTETTITQFCGFDTSGVAEFVRSRQAIQYSSSIDEWTQTMLTGNNGGYANDWLIGDNKTGEIARFEMGLKNHTLEKTKDGYFVGANYPVKTKLTVEETTFDTTLANSSPNARKLRWEQLTKEYKGKIDVEAAKKFMGDHYDAYNKKEKPSGLTLCGHIDEDPAGIPCWDRPPFSPGGAVQGKATDGDLASGMKLWAIIGHPCGEPFIAKDFLALHPEFSYQKDFLRDMPGEKWTVFGKDFKE